MTPVIVLIITSAFTDIIFQRFLFKLIGKNARKFLSISKLSTISPVDMFNVDVLRKFLSLLTPQERDIIMNELKRSQARNNAINNKKMSVNQQQQGFTLNNQKKQELKQMADNDPNYWTHLSSSWIKLGQYHSYGKTNGNLTIMINSDKYPQWYGPYTYPNIPVTLWESMKSAKGKNGTGAGSVFWREWLYKWLPSRLREYITKNFNPRTGTKALRLSQSDVMRGNALINQYRKEYKVFAHKQRIQKAREKEHIKNLRAKGLITPKGYKPTTLKKQKISGITKHRK